MEDNNKIGGHRNKKKHGVFEGKRKSGKRSVGGCHINVTGSQKKDRGNPL